MTMMTKKEKKKFARELSRNIFKSFEELLDAGRIPERWTGHEIRCWLADRHKHSADMSCIRAEPRSKRAREYKNDIIIHNL